MNWMLMPFKRYADFSGRSRRMEFWMWVVLQVIVYVIFWVLLMVVGGSALMMGASDPAAIAAAGGGMMIIGLLYLVYALAAFIPNIAVSVRRLHDTNRTGWWILAPLAPYVLMFIGGAMAAASPDAAGLGGILALVGGLGVLALALVLLVFYFLEGTKGPNKYGPDPKGEQASQVFA